MFTPFAFIQPVTTVAPIVPTTLQHLLIGGDFTTYNTPAVSYIAKIDSTGSLDPSFNMGIGFNNTVNDIKQQPDGKYVIVGQFTNYSGSTQNRITRINQDGTRDTTFNIGVGFNTIMNSISPQSNNSNIVVGSFTTYSGSSTTNGIPINGILKLTPSGAIDTTFNVGYGLTNNTNYDIITQADGKIIVGGTFTQYSQSNNYITRTDLSGSRTAGPGSGFNIGVGFNSTVNTYATQSDGKILVGGNFGGYSGSSTNVSRIIRLNTNGTQDTSFVTGTGFNNQVNNIKIQSDGKIIVVGNFSTYSGSTVNGIVRINTNGTRDTSFNVGTGLATTTTGIDIAIQSDNKILVAGAFTAYSGSSVNRLVRINTDGTRDTTFNIGAGFDNNVNSISLQSDGNIIASGLFLNFSGSSRAYIARLTNSGSYDTTFNIGSGFNNSAFKNAIEPTTGKILVMGSFTTYSGSSTNTTRIIRLNTDGTRDTSFVTGTGLNVANISPAHLSVESDGKIYVGSNFTTYSGSTVNRFVRIDSSGSLDTTFPLTSPSSSAGFDNAVRTILVSGSNIYFGGDFTAYRPTNRIIRLNTDGTQDTTFIIGEGFDNTVTSLSLQSDGKIIVGGTFSNYSGSSRAQIARLNPDGTRDNTFNPGTVSNFVLSTDIQSDGKILVGGIFTTFSGSASRYIARITNSGSYDPTFNVGTGIDNIGGNPKSLKILSSPDGKVYFTSAGTTTYSGSYTGAIIRINSSGTLDTTFVTTSSRYPVNMGGLTGVTSAGGYTLILSGSTVIVGGAFTLYKEASLNRGIMANLTGPFSSSFNIGINTGVGLGFNSAVQTWVTQSDGKILAGGDFTNYSGSSVNRIVRINQNGTRDTTFNIGAGFNSTVRDLKIQSDGKIIAIGPFTTYSGSSSSGIIRLNTDGTRDTIFNVGTGLTPTTDGFHSLIQSDSKIIVVGQFTIYSGSTSNRIVRINTDGTRDTSFNVGTGFPQNPEAVIIQPDNKILVAGGFTSYSGSASNRIIRINTDGTRDTTFNIGTGLANTGYALALQSDGKIICANASQTYSGSTNRYIIRINDSGSLDNTFNANANISLSSTSNTPNSLAIDSDGKIYWGNTFTTFSGSFTPNRIVRLNTNGSVDETFNQDFPNFINNTGKGANGTVNAILLL